jgi:hypothetical protein
MRDEHAQKNVKSCHLPKSECRQTKDFNYDCSPKKPLNPPTQATNAKDDSKYEQDN